MRLNLTLTFLFLLTSCSGRIDHLSSEAAKIVDSKIYGGHRVKDGNWKSVVSFSKVNYEGKVGDSFCSGTLIDEKTVLSAAHCFSRVKQYYIKSSAITLENTDDTERTYTKIKNIRIHPKYTGEDSGFDFALVDLEKSAGVDLADIIAPSSIRDISVNDSVHLVGFGKIEDGSNGVKFEVETRVREDQADEFLAGGSGKDTCSGDSGGPVFIKNAEKEYEFFGVTSRTPDDATDYCGDKTIYGKVSTAMKWVEAERLIDQAIELDSMESIEFLNKAKLLYPRYFKTHSLLGKFYLKYRIMNKALENLIAASTLKVDDIETLNLLRESYTILEDSGSEIMILKRLLVLDPGSEVYFKRLVSLKEQKAAEISRGLGRFLKGDFIFANMDLELHKDVPRVAFILAFSRFLQNDYDSALNILKDITTESISFVNLRNGRGDTFLMSAAFEGQSEIATEILRFKPNLNLVDSFNNNIAQVAWWAREFDLVEKFVSLGVDWNPDDYFKQFISFVSNEYINEVRFMLEMGLDTSLVGPNGETAFNLAKETNNRELIELVESYGKEESLK